MWHYAPARLEDQPVVEGFLRDAYLASSSPIQAYVNRVGLSNLRCLRTPQGRPAGCCALLELGQWFGGKRVSALGVAAVAIAPDSRGQGAALHLMQQALQEMADRGAALSVLYPATQTLYRRVGYAPGGMFGIWELPLRTLDPKRILAGDPPLDWRPANPGNATDLEPLYTHWVKHQSGCLDRSAVIWGEVLKPEDEEPAGTYLVFEADRPIGYVLLVQTRQGRDTVLHIRDWVALTPTAGRHLWAFVARYQSQVDTLRWRGPALDPMLMLLPEQRAKAITLISWYTRILNIPQALSQRGYPAGLTGELHFQVIDPLLTHNHGNWVLQVSQGSGQAIPGGRGELVVTSQGLASLYTGLYSSQQLTALGHIQGDTPVLNWASTLFAGATPWMPDFF